MFVGDKVKITLEATLNGAPGSYEGLPVFEVIPPDAGVVSIIDGVMEFLALAVSAETKIRATVDNIEGAIVGELVGESAPFAIEDAPKKTADALSVKVGTDG